MTTILRLLQVLANVFDRPGEPVIPLKPIFDLLRREAPDARRRYGGLYTRGAFVSPPPAAGELMTDDGQWRTLGPVAATERKVRG